MHDKKIPIPKIRVFKVSKKKIENKEIAAKAAK